MNERLFKKWNFMRILYLLIGGATITAGLLVDAWLILIMGLFFVYMSIFSLGCASGQCSTTDNISTPKE